MNKPLHYNVGIGMIVIFAIALVYTIVFPDTETQVSAQESAQVEVGTAPTPEVAPTLQPKPVSTPEPEVSNEPQYDMDKVMDYLKEIFGSDWKVAYAVAQAECNTARKDWPHCNLSWAKEHSWGWFQINIAENEGHGKKVHWDKIPGETLEEKEQWLTNPYNNILIAKLVHDRAGGFGPWTGYTSGNYLHFLPK